MSDESNVSKRVSRVIAGESGGVSGIESREELTRAGVEDSKITTKSLLARQSEVFPALKGLTEEEKHDKRSEAAKKVWERRRKRKANYEKNKAAILERHRKWKVEHGYIEADKPETHKKPEVAEAFKDMRALRVEKEDIERERKEAEAEERHAATALEAIKPDRDLLETARKRQEEHPVGVDAEALRKVDITLSEEQVELVKRALLMTDRALWVKTLGFQPYEWQEAVLSDSGKRKVILGSRQGGKSTIVNAVPYHTALFYPGSLCLIFAPTQDQSRDDMSKVKAFIALDRNAPRIVRDSAELVELENGSRIQVVTASDESSRGKSHPRCIIIDEASRVGDVVYKSAIRPMLNENPDCEMILISTPFGQQGFFYEACVDDHQRDIWHRYMVVSPFYPEADGFNLFDIRKRMSTVSGEAITFFEQREREAKRLGAKKLYISPRSDHYEEQRENLVAMGPLLYQQEFDCEFVEQDGAVFSYSQIDRAFQNGIDLKDESDCLPASRELLLDGEDVVEGLDRLMLEEGDGV